MRFNQFHSGCLHEPGSAARHEVPPTWAHPEWGTSRETHAEQFAVEVVVGHQEQSQPPTAHLTGDMGETPSCLVTRGRQDQVHLGAPGRDQIVESVSVVRESVGVVDEHDQSPISPCHGPGCNFLDRDQRAVPGVASPPAGAPLDRQQFGVTGGVDDRGERPQRG